MSPGQGFGPYGEWDGKKPSEGLSTEVTDLIIIFKTFESVQGWVLFVNRTLNRLPSHILFIPLPSLSQ